MFYKVSNGGTTDIVLLAFSENSDIQGIAWKALTYTNDNKMRSLIFGIVAGTSIEGTDFAGTIKFNNDITIKKAGTYEINDNGTISTVTLSANATVTPQWTQYTHYWSIRKIK